MLVMNDAAGQVVEQATYCKPNDEKRPQRVGLPDFTARDICPADLSKGADEVTNAYPDGWYVRIVFDELLDPSIEELTEIKDPETGEGTDVFEGSIANTQPVKLECESIGGGFVEVDYDGYYSPSGNNVTWPLGPSLVIKPLEPKSVATNKACRVTINDNVVDKSGNKVPSDQRTPFTFKIAPIQVIALDPADDPMGSGPIDPFVIYGNGDNVYVQFNTEVDSGSFCDDGAAMDECEFGFTPEVGECSTAPAAGGATACEVSKNGADCPTAGDTCDFAGADFFPLALNGACPAEYASASTRRSRAARHTRSRCSPATSSRIAAARRPRSARRRRTTSSRPVSPPSALAPDHRPALATTSPMRKLAINFNNVVDVASLDPSEYTLTPALANATVTSSGRRHLPRRQLRVRHHVHLHAQERRQGS
ncbi:MAG: hypothetical protein IPQ07_02220 [Myxococcales bacterium]|nr:hypothetical protein [Myxococcales bacterium]